MLVAKKMLQLFSPAPSRGATSFFFFIGDLNLCPPSGTCFRTHNVTAHVLYGYGVLREFGARG